MGSANMSFCKIFAENCTKMKEFGGGGGGLRVPGALLESVTAIILSAYILSLNINKKYGDKKLFEKLDQN